ncbi:50S ribosomal protein L15-like [Schistocerca gregaria]|uniref:50S ribosomal protein L15-like n=1 Tax=Schistocerca gregaria TaxID=7010 RepID=UPI00211DE37D|nr:50S ribosomal protein L15-like [Schistocerca gregaria]
MALSVIGHLWQRCIIAPKSNTRPSFLMLRRFHQSVSPRISMNDVYLKNVERNRKVISLLNTISDNPGARKKRHILGRGIGSGRGKTCTKGHKGRKVRQGGSVNLGFEGGQVPFYKRFRKHGFTNRAHKRVYSPVSLARLQFWIDTGRIDPNQKITMKTLIDSKCVGRLRKLQVGIKLVGDGADWWKQAVDIEVSQASSSAINAIKRTSGKITLVYYNKTGLRALLKPHKYYPNTKRRFPYLPPPPEHINKKLLHPMVQPSQFPQWIEEQALLAQQTQKSRSTASADDNNETQGDVNPEA